MMEEFKKVEVKKISEVDIEKWESLIHKTDHPVFFASFDYLKAFGSDVYILLLTNGEEIIAGLPFVLQSLVPVIGQFFKICRVETEVQIKAEFTDEQKQKIKEYILFELMNYLKKKSVASLYITTKIRSKDGVIYENLGFTSHECGTYMLSLEAELESIQRNFSKGHKSSIQKAIKSGVEVNIYENELAKEHIHEFLETQKKLYERRHDSLSVVYLKSEKFLRTLFSAQYNKVIFAVAKYNSKPAATGIFVTINDVIYYYAGNSDYELVRECQASNFLQLEVIKYAKEAGYLKYDFGGAEVVLDPASELYGVTLFKRGFGGELMVYDYGKYIVNPLRNKLLSFTSKFQKNKFVSSIYRLLKNAK